MNGKFAAGEERSWCCVQTRINIYIDTHTCPRSSSSKSRQCRRLWWGRSLTPYTLCPERAAHCGLPSRGVPAVIKYIVSCLIPAMNECKCGLQNIVYISIQISLKYGDIALFLEINRFFLNGGSGMFGW